MKLGRAGDLVRREMKSSLQPPRQINHSSLLSLVKLERGGLSSSVGPAIDVSERAGVRDSEFGVREREKRLMRHA